MRRSIARLAATLVAVAGLGTAQAAASGRPENKLVKRSDVEFIPLNPARGELGPKAGKLWGDIRTDVPSGVLVKFVDGFQSPPHIHNITYRAVVISGAVHNDDPAAEKMWMESGSFWTQPPGETHITAAKGENSLIFLEILSGPYLVKPADEAFDSGERPINVAARNIMWLEAEDAEWVDDEGPEMAYLWGSVEENEKNGTFVKLPSGYGGELSTSAPMMRAVTIQGRATIQLSGESDTHSLDPGSYFGSKGEAAHRLSCDSDEECILYLHTEGKYQLRASL